jgi:hypothetical protein
MIQRQAVNEVIMPPRWMVKTYIFPKYLLLNGFSIRPLQEFTKNQHWRDWEESILLSDDILWYHNTTKFGKNLHFSKFSLLYMCACVLAYLYIRICVFLWLPACGVSVHMWTHICSYTIYACVCPCLCMCLPVCICVCLCVSVVVSVC